MVKHETQIQYYDIVGVNAISAGKFTIMLTHQELQCMINDLMVPNQEIIFNGVTGCLNLNIRRNSITNLVNCGVKNMNISGLSNYYDKSESVSHGSSIASCDSASG